MKKITSIIALSSLVAITTVATVSASIAWFNGIASLDDNTGINGGSQGAYFARGTGKSNDPYIIKNKWHIYNLAWLTYIGWFDDPNGWGKNNPADEKQPYFKCEADNGLIDMQNMVLPPIGTSIHPFMGSFNGNNNVIYNFSISNIYGNGDNNITRKPTIVETPLTNIDIVGFFGVVGLLPSNVETFPTYNNQKNNITNLGLEDFTIQTQASANGNLVGLAAGYVNTNISGIGVGESNFDIAPNTNLLSLSVEKVGDQNIKTSYISHFGTIGYCAQQYIRGVEVRTASAKNPKVEDGNAAAAGNLFGNSIPMKDIYSHLLSVKGAGSQQDHQYSYISRENAYYRNDQHLTDPYRIDGTSTTEAQSHSHGDLGDFSYAGVKENDSNSYEIASYNFENRKNTDNYIYLDGERTVTINNGLTERRYEMKGGLIHDGKGHYLGRDDTNIVSVDEANAISWATTTGGYLTTQIGNQTYYLYSAQTGSLTLSRNNGQRTSWQVKDDMFYNANVGFLLYDGEAWTTRTHYTDFGYYIFDGNDYLSTSGTNLANASGQENATKWVYFDGYLSTQVNTTVYYLYSSATGSLTLSTTNKTQWTIQGDKFYRNDRGYIVYDGNNWTTSSALSGTITLGFNISYGGNYFGLNGNTPTATDQEHATLFEMDGNNIRSKNNPTYYITSNGYSTTGNKLNKDGNKLYYENNTWVILATYYRQSWLAYDNGWTIKTNEGWSDAKSNMPNLTYEDVKQRYDYSNVSMSVVKKTYDMHTQITPREETYVNQSTKNASYDTNSTYFPLQYKNNYQDIGDTNTGYIVGGTYDGSPHGSIRVSKYAMGHLYNSLNGTAGSGNSDPVATYAGNKFEVITKNINSLSDTNKNGYVRITDSVYNTSHPSMNSTMRALNAMTVDDLQLTKYDSARSYFHETLNGASDVYGLHFMNALIDKNNTIYGERTKMGGWEYLPDGTANHYILKRDEDGYPLDENGNRTDDKKKYVYIIDETIRTNGKLELPSNSVDFVLTENGYINFFAGSYFPTNNTFFSLHQIFRKTSSSQQIIDDTEVTVYDKNEISDIKEIRKIYKNNGYSASADNPEKKYIYVYNDGKYSLPNGGISQGQFIDDNPSYATELIFDMSWVTDIGSDIIMNACYYFEIPVNDGEYALGSVSGANGAYLMYLDIGASDKTDDIIFAHEKITNTVTTHDIPKGVDFVDSVLPQGSISYQTVNEGDTGTLIVPKNSAGYKVSFNLSDDILTCGAPNRPTGSIVGNITQSTYNALGVTMNFNGAPISVINTGSSTVVQNIKTKYTYNSEGLTLNKEVVISYTDTSGTKIAEDKSYSELTSNLDRATYESTIKLALTNGTEDVYAALTYHSMVDEEVDIEYLYSYDNANEKYIYIFTFVSPDGGIDVDVNVSTIINDSARIVVLRGIDDTPPEEGQEPPENPADKDQTITATGTYRVRTKVKTTYDEEP